MPLTKESLQGCAQQSAPAWPFGNLAGLQGRGCCCPTGSGMQEQKGLLAPPTFWWLWDGVAVPGCNVMHEAQGGDPSHQIDLHTQTANTPWFARARSVHSPCMAALQLPLPLCTSGRVPAWLGQHRPQRSILRFARADGSEM